MCLGVVEGLFYMVRMGHESINGHTGLDDEHKVGHTS